MNDSPPPVDGMFIEVRSKRTGLLIGRHYICESCRKRSVLIKPDEDDKTHMPASWSKFHKMTSSRRHGFSVVICVKCKTCTNRETVEAERARPGIWSRALKGV